MATLFGTDGIRGPVGTYPMTEQGIRDVANAIARFFLKHRNIRQVLIARDTRASGELFERAAGEGVIAAGSDAAVAGVLPTPGAAYLCRRHGTGGIVLSASHNPAGDNGIKVILENGQKASSADEALIERMLADRAEFSDSLIDEDLRGTVIHAAAWTEEYAAFLEENCTSAAREWLSSHAVVLDCANGAASSLGGTLLARLGARAELLGASPDGKNINRECGATHPGAIVKATVDHKAAAGFAFDGDADRVIAVDENGALVDGDRIMLILAGYLKRRGKLLRGIVVATDYSNLGLRQALSALGCSLVTVPNGDRHVAERMRALGCALGGEQSGHIVLMPEHTTGDGLLTMLMLLNAMADSGKPLSALHAGFHEAPQVLLSVVVREKRELASLAGVQRAMRDACEKLRESGRVVVRYSGTEMVCRVMVEAPSKGAAERWARTIAAEVSREVGR